MSARQKLTDDQVRHIRRSLDSAQTLADQYDVSTKHVLAVRRREYRANVPQKTPQPKATT